MFKIIFSSIINKLDMFTLNNFQRAKKAEKLITNSKSILTGKELIIEWDC